MNINEHTRSRVWLVWSPTGRPPNFQHNSKSSAVTEAKRLAACNPGQDFFVLRTETGFYLPRQLAPAELHIVTETEDRPW